VDKSNGVNAEPLPFSTGAAEMAGAGLARNRSRSLEMEKTQEAGQKRRWLEV
jgi:hypothetical protein